MSFLRTFYRFTKLEHTIFSLPIVFAGAYLGADRHIPEIRTLALIVMAATGGRILGMAMNRILDRKIDAVNDRTKSRELPSGIMSIQKALLIAATGLAVYLASCAMLGPLVLTLSPVPAFFLIVYSLLKRFTWLCHYGIGIVLGMAPLAAYVAVKTGIAVSPEIILLSGFTFFWISGYDIIYALQDIDFDRKSGIHSLPARFGSTIAQVIAAFSHLAAFSLLVAMAVSPASGTLVWIPITCCGIALFMSYIPWIPLPVRFFPMSAVAGIAGSLVAFF